MYFLQYVMEDEHTKGPSHNNPEEAANYVIITKQSINSRKIHEVNHIDVGHEDEIEINKAHVRNPNYKGKNYNPNFAQNRLKATNNNTNTSNNQNNNMSSYGPSGQHSNNNLGYGYSKSNQQENRSMCL